MSLISLFTVQTFGIFIYFIVNRISGSVPLIWREFDGIWNQWTRIGIISRRQVAYEYNSGRSTTTASVIWELSNYPTTWQRRVCQCLPRRKSTSPALRTQTDKTRAY